MISKYQFMEMNTQRRSVGLKEKIPDIKKTLDMVRFLKVNGENNEDDEEKGGIETHFELNDTLYARAKVAAKDTEEVYLWLGANVMLAYPIAEAETMLSDKLAAAELSLANCEEDLEFLREQITVLTLPLDPWLLMVVLMTS
jgi:prefoldin subunit 5